MIQRCCHDPPSNPRFSKVASTSCTASRVSLLSQTSEAYWSLMTQTANYQQLFSSLLTHYTLPKLIFFFFGPLHILIKFGKSKASIYRRFKMINVAVCGTYWSASWSESVGLALLAMQRGWAGTNCYESVCPPAWVALSGPATQWSRHRAWEPVSEHPGPMTDADTAVTYFMLQFTQLAILEYQIAIVLQRVKECMKCADK